MSSLAVARYDQLELFSISCRMKLAGSLYFLEFLIVFSAAIQSFDNLELELVQVLFRHGARTPVQVGLDVCNYTETSAYEPWGLGELTNQGKQQEYAFGNFLRNRYANYLRSIYKSEDVYGYASDMSRTKMSMELVLAGLYPPVGRTTWNPFLNWSPIPYAYVPNRLDVLLRGYENSKYVKLREEVTKSNEYKNSFSQYNDFYKYVAEHTVYKDNSSLSGAALAFDVLISNEYMNLPLPDWYTPDVRQTFIEIMELLYDFWAATTELKKFSTGPLIKTFIDNMNLNGTINNPRKIYLYGGHDINLAMFTRAHNIQEFRYPWFGSALIFEKLRDSRGQVFVRLLAWDGLGQLTTLKLNNNEEYCSIEDYLEIVKPVVPSEMEIDDMIGSLNPTEIKNLLFNSTPVAGTASFGDYFN